MKIPRIIAVDFDGTCVEHEFPKVGADVPHAERVLKRLSEEGVLFILWTMRSDGAGIDGGDYLSDAVEWFAAKKIPIWGINRNPNQSNWTASPKAYAPLYIDDAALGCPLIHVEGKRSYVDWLAVEKILFEDA